MKKTPYQERPFFGPVDVWVWRVLRADGGAVRAYAPLFPWIEEDRRCLSHSGSPAASAAAEPATACPAGLPAAALRACAELRLLEPRRAGGWESTVVT